MKQRSDADFIIHQQCLLHLPQHHQTQPTVVLYLTEGFGDVGLHLPVHSPPHLEAVVVGLGGDVLPHWIPRQTFNQPGVAPQTRHHLWKDAKKTERRGGQEENTTSPVRSLAKIQNIPTFQLCSHGNLLPFIQMFSHSIN